MDTKSLLQVIKASKDLSPRDFNMAVEAELAKNISFNHESESSLEACGVDIETFKSKTGLKAKGLSVAVEQIEVILTKRELAFIYIQAMERMQDPAYMLSRMLGSH